MNISMQVVGWTLIHFVWQGTAIGLVVAAALRLTERRVSPPCSRRRPRLRDCCGQSLEKPRSSVKFPKIRSLG